jgi:hypothetical protein
MAIAVRLRAGTFLLVVVGWTLFRATSWQQAVTILQRMFTPVAGTPPAAVESLGGLILLAGALAHVGPNTFEIQHRWRPAAAIGWAAFLVLSLMRIYGTEGSPFLYFQF